MTPKSADLKVNDMAARMEVARNVSRGALAAVALVLALTATRATAQVTLGSPGWTQVGTATTTSPVSGTFAKPTTGANRIILVAVVAQYSTARTTFTNPPVVTYGTTTPQTATAITSTATSSRQKVWFGYLTEAQIAAAGGTATLSATLTTTSLTQSALYAAVYNNVDQATPLNAFAASSSDTTSASPAPGAVAYVANGVSVYACNYGNTTATSTPAAAYTDRVSHVAIGTSFSISIGDAPRAAAGSANDAVSLSAASRYAIANVALDPAAVIIGNGSAEPASTSYAAGAVVPIDAFALSTSSGTATVTAVEVTLAISAGSPLTGLFVSSSATCSGGTTYGTLASAPVNGVNAIGLTTSYSATTATGATNLYVCGTAASIGASATVSGTLSGATAAGYAVTDNDTTSATATITAVPALTIGNGSAEPASSATGAGGVGALDAFTLQAASGTATLSSVTVALTNPAALSNVFISSSATCSGGTTYGTLTSPGASALIPVSGLTAGTTISANLYVCATAGAVATATPVTGNVSAVAATGYASAGSDTSTATLTVNATAATTIGDGVNPASTALLCPSGAATMLDAFTLSATVSADVVNRLTVQLTPSGAWVNVALVEITNAAGSTVYGSAVPGGDQVAVWVGSLAVPVGPATTYMVRITPKTYSAMPAPNVGQQFAMGGTVVAAASTNARTYADTASATVTIDNAPPADVTWSAPTSGATNIQLNWTAATNVVVLRKAGGPVADAPADGTTYTAGAALGASTVACVGSLALCNSTGLTAGVAYYFEVFTSDSCTNYSLGAPIGPLYAGGVAEGNPSTGTLVPVVGILNPRGGATVTNSGTTGFRVQVRAFSRRNGANAQPLTAVRLKAATATGTFSATCDATNYPIALTLNANYPNSVAAGTDNHGTYEATIGTTQLGASKGAFTLRACAVNASGTVLSGSVGITVNDGSVGSPRGDGNLLVRDNGGQLCVDCHQVATHSSEATGTKYGSWYTDCRDCHTPHNTTNIYLVNNTITPPSVNGVQGPKAVKFSTTTGDSNSAAVASASFANSDSSGPCQVCHTRTANPGTAAARWRNTGNADTHYTAASGTQACTDCHSHTQGFGAAESTGGTKCSGCHKTIWNTVTGATPGIVSKHTLGSVLGVNDSPTDSGITWASPLSGNAPAARSCVNMCHDDHVHNPVAGTTHDADTYANATTTANRAMTRAAGGLVSAGAPARTDFDTATSLGTCVSCHQYPVESGTGATHPAIGGAAFNASAHDFISNTVGTTTYQWDYVLHDGSTYDRNCTKCHASRTEGNTPTASGTGLTAVHGTPDPSLLSGATNPAGSAAGFVCYNCHGTTATQPAAAGAQGNRSGKDIQAEITGFYHPVNSDAVHSSAAEGNATFNGGRFSGTNRHVSCLDCHDPHEAGATKVNRTATATSTRNQLPAGSPLQGATGITFGPTYPALVTTACGAGIDLPNACVMQTTAANYGTSPVAATLEYQVCFKCHTAYAFGTTFPTAPATGASGTLETDLGSEFSPTNRSGHPVVVGLSSYTNSPAPKALVAAQLLAPWATNVGTQTMLCTDCHNTDAASPAVQGPHGSAVRFMLAGTNKAWPFTVAGATSGTAFDVSTSETGIGTTNGLFCRNCHPASTATGSNWMHKQLNADGGHAGHFNCVNCHIRVPHGGKVSRLILTDNAPARYKTTGYVPTLSGFAKYAKDSYTVSTIRTSGGCNQHTQLATYESW